MIQRLISAQTFRPCMAQYMFMLKNIEIVDLTAWEWFVYDEGGGGGPSKSTS